MKIRFVYHKGKDSLVGRAIVVWTWLLALARLDFKSLKNNFSHVEVWFPDENGNFNNGSCGCHLCYKGQCFSSTTRGDAEGVRFAPANKVLHHPERWMYQEFEVPDYWVRYWKAEAVREVGKKYDFAGIAGFFIPVNIQEKNKWYCSEICAKLAWNLSIIKKWFKRISPRRLAKVLGGKLCELK